uniref:Thioredoxin domain-containing protein n=1 Tax=Clastoptera arizonana TaxID=38151 RepID=A0A1B6CQ45_9HEMI
MIKDLISEGDFDSLTKGNICTVVYFSTTWSIECKFMDQVVKTLSKDGFNKGVEFLKVDSELFPTLALRYNVTAVPTFVFLRYGVTVDRVDGTNAADLTIKVNSIVDGKPSSEFSDNSHFIERLKRLINRHKVMLFMKGSPEQPQCGFSKKMVALLNEHNISYDTFDVLTDFTVRDGLKEYSEWPTYPQLYVNGKLQGGLDVVTEMIQSGDLQELLAKAAIDG